MKLGVPHSSAVGRFAFSLPFVIPAYAGIQGCQKPRTGRLALSGLAPTRSIFWVIAPKGPLWGEESRLGGMTWQSHLPCCVIPAYVREDP